MASENVYAVIQVFKKDGKEPVASHELRKRTFLIGRNANCDMRILDKRISGEHCILEMITPIGLVYLRDLTDGSAIINVNGKATRMTWLFQNDILHILNRKFKFQYAMQKPHSHNRKSKDAASLCSINRSGKRMIRSGGEPAPSKKRNRQKSMENASLELDLGFREQLNDISVSSSEKNKNFAKRKRSVSNNSLRSLKKKKVSFGPYLSPEQFDGALPPSTPIKKGCKPNSERNSLLSTLCEGSHQSSSSSTGNICLPILKQVSSKKTARPGTPFVNCNSSASKSKSGTKGRPTSKKLSLASLLETVSDSDAKDKLIQTMSLPSPTASTNFHSELNDSTCITSVKPATTSVTPDISSKKCLMKDVFASSKRISISPVLSSPESSGNKLQIRSPNSTNNGSSILCPTAISSINVMIKDTVSSEQYKRSSLPILTPSSSKIEGIVELSANIPNDASMSSYDKPRKSLRLTNIKNKDKNLSSQFRLEHLQMKETLLSQMSNEPFLSPSPLSKSKILTISSTDKINNVMETVVRRSFTPVCLSIFSKARQSPRLTSSKIENKSLGSDIHPQLGLNQVQSIQYSSSADHVSEEPFSPIALVLDNKSLPGLSTNNQNSISEGASYRSFKNNSLTEDISPTFKELSLSPIDSMPDNNHLSKSSPEKANDHSIIHSSCSKSQYSVDTVTKCKKPAYDHDLRSMTHHSTPVSYLASKPRLFNTMICGEKNSAYTRIESKERPIKKLTPSTKVELHEKSNVCMVDFDVMQTAASSIPPVISSDDCRKTCRKNLNKKQASVEVSPNKTRVLRPRNISLRMRNDRIDVTGRKDAVKLHSGNAEKQRPENCQKKSKGFSSEILEGNKTEEGSTQIRSSKQTGDTNVKGVELYNNSPDFSLINSKNERKEDAHSLGSDDLDAVHEKYTRNKQASKAAVGNYDGLRSRKACQKVKIDPELSDAQGPSIDAKLPKKRAQVQKHFKYQKKPKALVNENAFEKQDQGISTQSSKLSEDKAKQTEVCIPLKDFPVTEKRNKKKLEANSFELDNSGILLKSYAGKKRMSPKVSIGNCRTLRSKKASENRKQNFKHPNVCNLNADTTVQKKVITVKELCNYEKKSKTIISEISDGKENVGTRTTRKSKLNGIEVKQAELCSDLRYFPLTAKGNKRKLKTESLESPDSSPILEMHVEEVQVAAEVSLRKCRGLRSRTTFPKERVDPELSHVNGSKSNTELQGRKARGKKSLSDEKKNNKAKGKTLALRGGKIPGSLPLSCKTNKRDVKRPNEDSPDTYQTIETFPQCLVSTETKYLRTRNATSAKVKTSVPKKKNELPPAKKTKNQKQNLHQEQAKSLKYARTGKSRTPSGYVATALIICATGYVLKKEAESPANKRITRAARKRLIHV